ncbi:MAG: selenium-binding protein [Verrucomicrobia bacterium 13_1_20CM_4_54_11]|nr:MAG: selenium-binding protein [Verrucomicrobia bacterium 13_1_20CM_4_54_11]
MKKFITTSFSIALLSRFIFAAALAFSLNFGSAFADETCSSPYLARIDGQEEFVYVWTLGVEGMGDGADKLVTVDVKPGSPSYGKVVSTRPQAVKTIDNFADMTGGAIGPHGAYALPGRVLIPCLSNAKDHGGRTALVEISNDGDYITTHWLPTKDDPQGAANADLADGYGYDARVLPRKNALLTSSFTGWNNYMNELSKVTADPEAVKHFGSTMVMWDFHARQPKKIFSVPGAPLEIRWAWGDKHNYAFTATALTSKLWLVYADDKGDWQAKEVATVGNVKGGVLPVDISLSADDKTLFVDCFGDGKCRVFDVSDPHKPKQIYEKQIGKQVNMVSQSWDGKRLYFTSSLLEKWDKKGADNEQFVRAYSWDGKELKPQFALDFTELKLGRPHHMLFGSSKLGPNRAVASK